MLTFTNDNQNLNKSSQGDNSFAAGINPCLQIALLLYEIDIQQGFDIKSKFAKIATHVLTPLDRQIVEEGSNKAKALESEFSIKRKLNLKDNFISARTYAENLKQKRVAALKVLATNDTAKLSFFSQTENSDKLGTTTHYMSSGTPVKVRLENQFDQEFIPSRDQKKEFLEKLEREVLLNEYTEFEIKEAQEAIFQSQSLNDNFSEEKEKAALKKIFRITCSYLIKSAAQDTDLVVAPIRLENLSFDWDREHNLNPEHYGSISVCSDEFKDLVTQHVVPGNLSSRANYLVRKYERDILKYEWMCLLFQDTLDTKTRVTTFKSQLATRLEQMFTQNEQYLITMSRNPQQVYGVTKFDFYKQNLREVPRVQEITTSSTPPTIPVVRGNIKVVSFGQKDLNNEEDEGDTSQNQMYITSGEEGAPLTRVLIMGQAPISRSPDGRAIAETRTEKTLKSSKSKTHWVNDDPNTDNDESKPSSTKKGKRQREEPDLDEDQDPYPQGSKEKSPHVRKTRSNQSGSKVLRLMESLTQKVDNINHKVEEVEKRNSYNKSNSYSNARQNNNRTTDNSHKDTQKGSPYFSKPPDNACQRVLKGEWCNDTQCDKNHGKYVRKNRDGTIKEWCGSYKTKSLCRYLFSQRGCYFNHHVKNERVNG